MLPEKRLKLLLIFVLVFSGARLLNVVIDGLNRMVTVLIRNSVSRVLSEGFFKRTLGLEKRHIDSREEGDFLHQFSQIEMLTEGIASYFSNFVLVLFGMVIKAGFLVWLYEGDLVVIILGIIMLMNIKCFNFSTACKNFPCSLKACRTRRIFYDIVCFVLFL